MLEFLIILFLIFLNGIFAMSEIAMVSSRKSRLESAARKGDRLSKKALELSKNPGKFLSTVQIGITLIGILTGIYSGEKIQDDLEQFLFGFEWIRPYQATVSITLIVIVLTFLSLVLGELVPKRIGLIIPETITRLLAFPMYLISLIAAPFIWLLTRTSDSIMKIFNLRKSSESHATEEEIKAIIQEATEAGAVQEIEQDIVENVFHLGDRKINSLMTHRADILWLNTAGPVEEMKKVIGSSPHKSFPVCKGDLDHVEGLVLSKDLLNTMLKTGEFSIVPNVLQALFLTENTTAYKALERLRETKQHAALVVDEFGSVQGLLTLNDLVDTLVGDFVEELHENKEIVPREDGTFLVDASLPMPEFLRYFEIEISEDSPESQINSVGGLAFHVLKKLPHLGQKFQWRNLTLEIVDMDGRRMDKILVSKNS